MDLMMASNSEDPTFLVSMRNFQLMVMQSVGFEPTTSYSYLSEHSLSCRPESIQVEVSQPPAATGDSRVSIPLTLPI